MKSEFRKPKTERNPNSEDRKASDEQNAAAVESERLNSKVRDPKTGTIPNPHKADGFSYSPEDQTSYWPSDTPGAFELAEGKQLQNLHERCARFAEAIIILAKQIPQNPVNSRLIAQLVGAGTSIGANYCEADDAVSGKEFKLRVGTCRKEAKETMFFLRCIATAEPTLTEEARTLWREAKELNLIFGAIWRK